MKKQFTIALLFAVLVVPALAQSGKPLYTGAWGVQTYTFRRSFPNGVAATLDTIKSMGFTEVEGSAGNVSVEEFRKLCDERGIKIPSTGAGYEELVKDPMTIVKNAKVLGAKYVMCAWIPHNGDFTLDNAKKAVEDFNKAGKILKENGLTLCYHVHGFEFQPYEKGTLLDYIITKTNPEHVSFEMDIMWTYFGGGDPAALLKKYGSRWKLMHLKDLKKGTKKDLTGGTSQENDVTLGTGELDIPGILREAKKVGIKHYFVEDESSRILTQIPATIAYVKSLKE